MRVCPLCEFIYEDDQSLCDMDGASLVYDPAPLALAQGGALQAATPLAKSRLKRFAATAVTGIVAGTVLVLVFYVFTLRKPEQSWTDTPRDASYPAPPVTADSAAPPILDLSLPVPLVPQVEAPPIPPPTVDQTPTLSAAPSPTQPLNLLGPARKATSNLLPGRSAGGTGKAFTRPRAQSAGEVSEKPSSGPSRPLTAKLEESTRRPQRADVQPMDGHRKESRIGAFLKKTGRILKKPFS